MGYKPPRKIYTLDFTGTEYDGLEVSMRGMTVGEELDLNALQEQDGHGREVFELMTGLLVDWNVEDDNGPIPTTFDGVRSQEGALIIAIFNALRTAAAGVPDPLPEGLPSGEPSLVASIPTETLSESPLSLPA